MLTCFRVFKSYAQFRGRLSRRDYWVFILQSSAAVGVTFPFNQGIATFGIVLLALPFFAATSRRLQDAGMSGWWMLAFFAFFPGWALPFLLGSKKSKKTKAEDRGPDDDLAVDFPAFFKKEKRQWEKWKTTYLERQKVLKNMRTAIEAMNEKDALMAADLRVCELEYQRLQSLSGSDAPPDEDTLLSLARKRDGLQTFLANHRKQQQKMEQRILNHENKMDQELQEWRMIGLKLTEWRMTSQTAGKGGGLFGRKKCPDELAELRNKIQQMELERSAEEELDSDKF